MQGRSLAEQAGRCRADQWLSRLGGAGQISGRAGSEVQGRSLAEQAGRCRADQWLSRLGGAGQISG